MIKKCQMKDCYILAKLANQLWPSHSLNDLEEEFKNIITKNTTFFIYYEGGAPIAFAQVSLRNDYVEGTNSSPVAYLEGIFVEKHYRNKGIAKKLIKKCEIWAKQNCCQQMASDCELINTESYNFHLSCGFEEVNRIICFKKELTKK